MDDLVSTGWLAEHLGEPGLVVLDASLHLPDAGRDAAAEFAAAHPPGARFLDLASLTDPASAVPAALATGEQVAARLRQLGVGPGDRVVLYDDSAIRSSARAWFLLRLRGFDRVAILDGGLGKWRAEGRPLEAGAPVPAPAPGWQPAADRLAVRSKADMIANLASRAEQVVDARGAGRFSGAEPESRPGLASGHIPGSLNLPYGKVLAEDGTFRSPEALRAIFAEAGIDPERPIVTTCGSGVTAAVVLFALRLAGREDVALYDGSWSEWGADPATPKAGAGAGAQSGGTAE
ncbi:MAG: sulfurtransferase [Porphyrobacter sp.]|nr:sulfurtransferase [Porphyrobacter sp.]